MADRWGSEEQKRAISAHEKVKAANAAKARTVSKAPSALSTTGIYISRSAAEDRARNAKNYARWERYQGTQEDRRSLGVKAGDKLTPAQTTAMAGMYASRIGERGAITRQQFERGTMSAAEKASAKISQRTIGLAERLGTARDTLARDKFNLESKASGYKYTTDPNTGETTAFQYGEKVDSAGRALVRQYSGIKDPKKKRAFWDNLSPEQKTQMQDVGHKMSGFGGGSSQKIRQLPDGSYQSFFPGATQTDGGYQSLSPEEKNVKAPAFGEQGFVGSSVPQPAANVSKPAMGTPQFRQPVSYAADQAARVKQMAPTGDEYQQVGRSIAEIARSVGNVTDFASRTYNATIRGARQGVRSVVKSIPKGTGVTPKYDPYTRTFR